MTDKFKPIYLSGVVVVHPKYRDGQYIHPLSLSAIPDNEWQTAFIEFWGKKHPNNVDKIYFHNTAEFVIFSNSRDTLQINDYAQECAAAANNKFRG
jgi:hypothetical protein